MATHCAEIVSFRLVEGYSPEKFNKDAKKTLPIVQEFGGCLQRILSVDESGLWTDYILWKDHTTAMKAADVVPKDPRFAEFGNAIDPKTVTMRHASVAMLML